VTQTDHIAPSGLGGRSGGSVQPPSREAILRLRAWLADAELRDPPLRLMPGVEAYEASGKQRNQEPV
jgi:hypothetical protein